MRSDRQDDSTAAVGLAYQPPRRQPVSIRSACFPAQVVKPGRRHRLRRGCRLRPPRSGQGGMDETRRPQTARPAGGRERERIMPKHLPVPSGSVVIALLRDSCDAPGQITQNGRRRLTLRARMLRPCSGKPIRLDARETRAPLGFANDGSECSGITGIDFDVDSMLSRSGGQDAVTYM